MAIQERKPDVKTRRELFTSAGRWAALAGIAALSWLLARRGGRAARASECANEPRCESCSRLEHCILPPAQYTRRARNLSDA
ncbi:MAG: hypothetical protein ACYTF6_00255 [Planctomycetota bacterium]